MKKIQKAWLYYEKEQNNLSRSNFMASHLQCLISPSVIH